MKFAHGVDRISTIKGRDDRPHHLITRQVKKFSELFVAVVLIRPKLPSTSSRDALDHSRSRCFPGSRYRFRGRGCRRRS
jgi:hypothetical protein